MTTIASLSGLQVAAQLFDRAAAGQPSDLAQNVTDMIRATVAINATAAAVRTDDDTQQSLIDVLA